MIEMTLKLNINDDKEIELAFKMLSLLKSENSKAVLTSKTVESPKIESGKPLGKIYMKPTTDNFVIQHVRNGVETRDQLLIEAEKENKGRKPLSIRAAISRLKSVKVITEIDGILKMNTVVMRDNKQPS